MRKSKKDENRLDFYTFRSEDGPVFKRNEMNNIKNSTEVQSTDISCKCSDPCHCGSGKHYKECCLLTQMSLDKQIQNRGGKVVHARDNELSRAIMYLAKELIKKDTKAEYDFAVGATCMAWNLDAEFEADWKVKQALNKICSDGNSEEKKELYDLMMPIIEKKRVHYPDLNCLVTGFEVMENKGQFYLNIAYKRATGARNDGVH